MKGEYAEDKDEHHHTHNHTHNAHLFSKFPPPHLHKQPPKFQPSQFPPHPFPLASHDSEETDSFAAAPPTTTTTNSSAPYFKKPRTSSVAADDGGTVEVARRPRGRPPGSKNKPKPPPMVVTRDPEPSMAPYILEISSGSDIVDSLTRFTRRRDVGLCVLNAAGAVANVTLKQPSTSAPAGTVTFHGRFDILSLSAVLLLHKLPFCGDSAGGNGGFVFTISLAGPQGQIVGGKVGGPLLAAGTVYIIAASFDSPSYHRLPFEGVEVQNPAIGGSGESNSPISGGGDGGGSGSGGGSGGGGGPMGFYNCQMGSVSSDVIWAPTARPPY